MNDVEFHPRNKPTLTTRYEQFTADIPRVGDYIYADGSDPNFPKSEYKVHKVTTIVSKNGKARVRISIEKMY